MGSAWGSNSPSRSWWCGRWSEMKTPPNHALRIVFVTPEEPSTIPVFFERILPSLRSEVAAIAVVSPIYKNSSWFGQARRFVRAFGLREFAVEVALYVFYKAADLGRRFLHVGT